MKKFDCVVIGGGMVGAASALSMAQLGLTVALVEQLPPNDFSKDQPYDLRVSAISLSSQALLEQLGAWPQIATRRSCPYKRLGVWEHSLAYTEFNSEDIQQPHLGHIVENRLVQLALWQQSAHQENITLYCPEKLLAFTQQNQQIDVELASGPIQARLLIAADGANSKVRELAGIGITGWDYGQSAMLINVKTALAQQDITWQQFRPTGPVAMLPMPGNHASLVWYHHRDEIKRLVNLSNGQLAQAINQAFPERLGEIQVIDKASFPLTRRHANHYQQGQLLLLGDAAHTINPLAGQGVNLGFKDVKALQTVIAEAIGKGECWFDAQVLARYEQARRVDNLVMMSAMDGCYGLFSHPSAMVKTLRNSAFFLLNKASFAKKQLLAYACGLK